MTTSYFKNIHLSSFFDCYTWDSQVSLSSRMCDLNLLGVWEKYKQIRIKNVSSLTFLEQYTLKIMNIRTASLGSNFTGSYKKRVVAETFLFVLK